MFENFFCDLFRWFFDFFAFAFVRCERALTVRDTFVARPLTARTFQNEASWAWRRRRSDRTRVPCATRRRTMRTSSSRAECGPAASATASSDAGPSTPLPVRLNSVFNSGWKRYTKRPRLPLRRSWHLWSFLSTCVNCIIVRVATRTVKMGRHFSVRKKSEHFEQTSNKVLGKWEDGVILKKSGNFVSPEKWEPWLNSLPTC